MSADLEALSDHVGRLANLVVTSMSIGNEQANITLAVIGTIFLPLTFIAGKGGGGVETPATGSWRQYYLHVLVGLCFQPGA